MNRGRLFYWWCVLLLLTIVTSSAQGEIPSEPFQEVLPGKELTFPIDHGAHPEYKTEWWYFTGHLKSGVRTFGFELTFFRVGLRPAPISRSAWEAPSIYLAHFAVTDDQRGEFRFVEASSRGAFDEAGAKVDTLSVWLKDWHAKLEEGRIHLAASDPRTKFTLTLQPNKPIALHGLAGYSKKGERPEDASYYSSFTRLSGTGSLELDGERFAITEGTAWMDHEFSSSTLTREQLGWDWFALQLDTGEELMVYQLRDRNGHPTRYSSGTFIAQDGTTSPLSSRDFTISVLDRWRSPLTGITYPSRWELSVPEREILVQVTPTVPHQELNTLRSTGVVYWEGRSVVTGSLRRSRVTGNAYVELVGYNAPEESNGLGVLRKSTKVKFALPTPP